MLLGSQNVLFGLSIFEIGALLAAAGYVVSLFRDWRPMKSLRQENRELRVDLNAARNEIDKLKDEVAALQQATVPVLQQEIVSIAKILDRVGKHLDRLDHSVKANTAAVETLSKRRIIDEALSGD